MQGMTMRLFFAAWVSFLGFAATIYWYHASAPKQRLRRSSTPIAYLDSSPSEVQRKPTDHLLWEEVKQGEVLYTRDTIRASGKAGARIRMEESGSTIELEPDSVIVLEKSQGKVSLNLVNGGLFVQNEGGKGATKGNLEIKVGGTKLAASGKGLEMNIHKSQNGEANIAVTKGSVKAVTGSGKETQVEQGKSGTLDAAGLDSGKQLQALAPAANSTIDSQSAEAVVNFRWAPLPAGIDVWLEVGDTPGLFTQRGVRAAGQAGVLGGKITRGDHYWRLVAAKHGDNTVLKASVPVKLTVITLQPPEPLSPVNGTHVPAKNGIASVKFGWAGSGIFASYELVIAKGTDFHQVVASKSSAYDDELSIDLKDAGAYVWKIVGVTKDGGKHLDSAVRTLTVEAQAEKPAALRVAPVLSQPNEGAHVDAADAARGIALRWQGTKEITAYEVKIDRVAEDRSIAGITQANTKGPQYGWQISKPGLYQWAVRASAGDFASPWSKPRLLRVMPGRIAWNTDKNHPSESHGEEPIIRLAWATGGAKHWRLTYSRQANLTQAKVLDLSKPETLLHTAAFGTYYVRVDAIGQDGDVTGTSETRQIELSQPLALASPKLIGVGPNGMRANARGDLIIKWQAVAKAAAYLVILHDEKGRVVFKKKTEDTQIEVTSLLPGRLTIAIGTYNQKGELGPMPPLQNAEVPAQSAIAPPGEIHEIHIE